MCIASLASMASALAPGGVMAAPSPVFHHPVEFQVANRPRDVSSLAFKMAVVLPPVKIQTNQWAVQAKAIIVFSSAMAHSLATIAGRIVGASISTPT